MKIILHIIANSFAILAADYIVPGFSFNGSWKELLLAGIVLGIANSLIRPIITLLTFPLIFLTLGLFTIIINIAMLFLTARLVPAISISGFLAGIGALIIISLVNHLVLHFAKDPKKD
ncbi:MAG: hypothetical protein A2288_02175 [Candidatus Moranbacteria bacterium RIFOXYA12_FULL_44_15]|nr:MAG: hypothetical protein A2288_02175 [Candidatus Moranbacteria bacterium RIFOXYA12_FULL_44_15]OGI34518.1 MAG: hypothetical protein A2259_01235 [Candidatus Moranbacteria bacterium RIFOXYA2_FULL_43_15]